MDGGNSSQRPTLSTAARDHTQTQNNLRQATAALDSAFRRIRQLRHSILELADTMPSLDSTNSRIRNPNNIGPAHAAIILSDSTTETQADSVVPDMDRLRSTLPPSVMESLERFEAEQGERRTDRFPGRTPQPPIGTPSRQSTASRNVHSTSSRSHNSPTVAPSRDSTMRRSWLETQISRRRSLNLDDVSTSIGRRVAAREARSRQNTVEDSAPQREQMLLNTTALIAQNNRIEAQRILRSEQTAAERSDVVLERRRLSDAEVRSNRIDGYHGRGSQSSGPSATNVLPSRQVQSRRWRVVRADAGGRQTSEGPSMSGPSEASPGTSARLSALSNFSTFDNLGSPLTPLSRDRPILFDEPYSYAQPNLPARRRYSDDHTTATVAAENRSYLVRRRLNADGDELIHSINLSGWDEDDPSAWLTSERDRRLDLLFPSRANRGAGRMSDRGTYHFRSDSPTNQTPPEVPRRRRGWARLDPDGNDIPTDEEEELERTRSQFRVRALHNARAIAASSLHVQPDAASLMPVTRTSMLHEPGEDETVARVRINAQDATRFMTTIIDRSRRYGHQSTHSTAETVVPYSPDMFGSSLPFLVDPLPMPLDAMITSKSQSSNADRGREIVVPKQAIWAGR